MGVISLVEASEGSFTLRCWDIASKAYLPTAYSVSGELSPLLSPLVGPILPTTPPQAVLGFADWRFERVDVISGIRVAEVGLAGGEWPARSVAPQSGLYVVGDTSGTICRYRLHDHEEVAPRIRLPGPGKFIEGSGDGQWLLTVDGEEDASLRAWRISGDPPFFSLRFPWPYMHGQPFAVSDRRFLFRGSAGALLQLQLPVACNDALATLERRTWLALGTRRRADGELELISSAEWQTLRKALDAPNVGIVQDAP